MKRLAILIALLPCALAALERVSFTKVFPGSIPAFVRVTVDSTGAADYREEADDDRPLRFTLPKPDIDKVFATAEKLDHFQGQLESPAKVANMGKKTLRYEQDGAAHETSFNYTENLDARELADWFERAAETARARSLLESAAKYDKLGVNQALLYVQACWEKKRLIAGAQLLPLLDRIAKNDSFVNMARNRAATLAAQLRAEESQPTP
jgi:hypothetical protein